MWPFKKKPVRLCKDCKYFAPAENLAPSLKDEAARYATCNYLTAEKNLVTGDRLKQPGKYCSIIRTGNPKNSCGPSGKFWEPK